MGERRVSPQPFPTLVGCTGGGEKGVTPGGGHSGTEWLPTAKRPRGAEAVNAKV